jgi:hypothetical protein
MIKYFIFYVLFLFCYTQSFSSVVTITEPDENETLTIPAGQTTRNITVEWIYVLDSGAQLQHFVLKTDVGNFTFGGPAYSKTVNNVPYGSKDWKLEMRWYDDGFIFHVTVDNVKFKVELTTAEIKADNNFTASGGSNHGTMKIDGITRTIPLSGYDFTKYVGQNLTLQAIAPQTDISGRQRVWAGCNASYWDRNDLYRSSDQTYSFPVQSDDQGKKYKANLAQIMATTSGALASNETWFTNVTLTGNVTVPSGKTLTLTPCANVNLGSHSIISTGGTINKQSGAIINGLKATLEYSGILKGLFPTIQFAIDAAPANYIVKIPMGTFNENISVYGKNHLTIYGVSSGYTVLTGILSFYYCNNLIMGNLLYSRVNAIYCNSPSFYCNVSGSSSQTGLSLYNCTNFNQQGGYVYGCNTGLNASASSGWSQNVSYSSTYCNISSSTNANVSVAYNHFCVDVPYDFRASGGSITAYSCYYLPGHPVCYGNVIHTDDRSCMVNMNKITGEQDDFQPIQIQSDDPVEAEFAKVNASYFTLLKKINEAKEKGISDGELVKQLLNIIKDFKNFIKKNPQSALSHVALTTAANSFRLFEDNKNWKSFLDEIIKDKELVSLKGAAENLIIDYYSNIKDFNTAFITVDAVINNYKNDDGLLCEALLKKGLILSYDMKQPEKAADCFSAIINNYPGNSLVEFAENELEVLGYDKDQIEKEKATIAGQDEFKVDSYPNPFNPTTTIRYQLPHDVQVTIDVFNIQGQKVKTLIDDFQSAGSHEVIFDGSNLGSGVYFYRFKAGNFNKVKRMLLVK